MCRQIMKKMYGYLNKMKKVGKKQKGNAIQCKNIMKHPEHMQLVPYQNNMNCCIYKQHLPKQCMLNKIGPVHKMQLQ